MHMGIFFFRGTESAFICFGQHIAKRKKTVLQEYMREKLSVTVLNTEIVLFGEILQYNHVQHCIHIVDSFNLAVFVFASRKYLKSTH